MHGGNDPHGAWWKWPAWRMVEMTRMVRVMSRKAGFIDGHGRGIRPRQAGPGSPRLAQQAGPGRLAQAGRPRQAYHGGIMFASHGVGWALIGGDGAGEDAGGGVVLQTVTVQHMGQYSQDQG